MVSSIISDGSHAPVQVCTSRLYWVLVEVMEPTWCFFGIGIHPLLFSGDNLSQEGAESSLRARSSALGW